MNDDERAWILAAATGVVGALYALAALYLTLTHRIPFAIPCLVVAWVIAAMLTLALRHLERK